MNIQTGIGKLVLRGWEKGDEVAMIGLMDSDIYGNFADIFAMPGTEEEAGEWVGANVGNQCHVAMTCDGVVCGGIGVLTFPPGNMQFTALIYYWVGLEYRGRGYASAAVVAYVKWMFDQDGGPMRIEGVVLAGNDCSMAVLNAAGFEMEGTMRKAAFKGGRLLDVHVFSKVKGDVHLHDGRTP